MHSVMLLLRRATAAWHRGDTVDAVRVMRRVIGLQPAVPAWWAALGDLESTLGLHPRAARSYRRAIELEVGRGGEPPGPGLTDAGLGDAGFGEPGLGEPGLGDSGLGGPGLPSVARIRVALASALAESGDLAGAEEALRRAVEEEPTARHRIALAEACEMCGRSDEARLHLLRALRGDRRNTEVRYRLGCLYLWTLPHRAERCMRRILSIDANHGRALASLGLLVLGRGCGEEAESLLRRAVRTGEGGALPHVYLGHALLHKSDTQGAIRAYEDAIRIAPGDPHPWFSLGDLHRVLGDVVAARRAYREALRLDPGCADARFRLGYLHDEEGEPKEAARQFRRGLAQAPQHPWADDISRRVETLAEGA